MSFIVAAAFLVFALVRMRTYLHMYQQEEYDSTRLLKWMAARGALDKRASIALGVIGGLELARVIRVWMATLGAVIAFAVVRSIERDPRKISKKKLVMTGRAKRIYWSAFGVLVVVAAGMAFVRAPVILWIIPVQLVPLALIAGNALTTPYENRLQKRFWSEAHAKLRSLKPVIVGITGSYGKTSTKHLLGHVLEMQAPTLITPGSVNTPMGVARVVREQLGAHHKFFVCEMGAYGPGSIARLCRLAPPDVGVITAIGMAHYERFKTLETVAQTKFELAEAVAAKGGMTIIAEQVLEFDAAKRFREAHRESTVVVGRGEDCALQIVATAQTEKGIEAQIDWQARSYTLRAPIFGEHHISNMAVAFAAACTLGVTPEDAIVALASVPQIAHRLEVKTERSGARVIDDAYNSNPAGFASGLQLLSVLGRNGGRRILVTPGMVELGAAHDAEHGKIGELAGRERVDVLLAVVPERIRSLIRAYASANPRGMVLPCPDFATAQKWLQANLQPEDVVLVENDLPDVYETKLKL